MPAVPGACRTLALRCRAGVHACRGGRERRPGRVLAGRGAAPLSRLTPAAPLTGEPFGWKPFAKPPLQGEVDAPKGADGRVHCHLVLQVSFKTRQALALCFVGDDAGIVPELCGGADPRRRSTPQPLAGEPFGWKPFAPAQTPASRISPLRKAMSAPAGRSRRARVRRASSGAISTHCTRRLSQVVQYRRRLSAHRTTLYTV